MPTGMQWARWTYRYLSGRSLDGKVRTDCSYLRRGTIIYTQTGRASNWAHLPGWKRQLMRLGVPTAGSLTGWAYLEAPALTEDALVGATVVGTGIAIRKGFRPFRKYRTVRPLDRALEPYAELSANVIQQKLVVEDDLVQVPIAEHHGGRVDKLKDIDRVVAQRLGGEWDRDTNLKVFPFYLRYTPTPAPPGLVRLGDVLDAIRATEQHRPVLGLGARSEVLHLDFSGEIAHLAASIGTGGGKSSFLRYLVAQFAYHGVTDFDVCDVKMVSLAGMEDVPGLRIFRDVEEIWEALARARAEMDERYRILLKNPSKVFPRKVIILEEQNAFALETAIRWRGIKEPRDPKTAPVWADIAMLLVKARQVNMNIIGVYQRMSADAAGGGTLRDQYGLKLLSRFSPQAWDTLVGTRPRAASSAVPGRAIVVLGESIRQVQIPFCTPEEAMELVRCATPVPVTRGDNQQVSAVSLGTGTPLEPTWTLADAARQEWCTITYDTLKKRAQRARKAGSLDAKETYTREELNTIVSAPGQPVEGQVS